MAANLEKNNMGVPENFSVAETEKSKIRRFTKEQKHALEQDGFDIYELTGQSIKTLREAGNPFWSTWHENYPEIEALTSRKSEVAVFKELFISGSNNKTFSEQESLVENFSKKVSTKIPGVEAIIGKVPDYAELAFLSPIEQRLFGEEYCFNNTRTQTHIGSDVAIVGYLSPNFGLNVNDWIFDHSSLFVAPLIVPKAAK